MATTTPALSSPGIGSGLDVNGIVDKLMSVEQLPLQQLQKQEAIDQAKITAYGTLKSAIAAMQNAATALTKADAFSAVTVGSSDPTAVTASISGKPVNGSYSVNVSS